MKVLAPILLFIACTSAPSSLYIPKGSYPIGSGQAERDWAYERSGTVVTRQRWYDNWEHDPAQATLSAFRIDTRPVTQGEYAVFVRETGHRAPDISRQAYREQGFLVHAYVEVRPYRWKSGEPPPDRLDHPVVLVSRADAGAYCAWRGKRLPTELEWEAACRGATGRRFPWGNDWHPDRVHHASSGTAPVTSGTPPRFVLGNVFEWTGSDFDAERATLKGCSWDDAPGTCRCAFRHGRPAPSRHILIGFRCAEDVDE